jgi:hypothetical protein
MSFRLTINPRSATDVARVRDILEREFALHWPQSPKLSALDLLAEDYARDCRDLTLDEFREACAAARARAKYWPTPAAVLEASVALRAEARSTVTAADIVVTPPPTVAEIETSRMWLRRIKETLDRAQ